MIKLNDHYFIAWLKIKKSYGIIVTNNSILVEMTPNQYTTALQEYESTDKSLLKEIRRLVKELNTLTSKPNLATKNKG